MKKIMTLFLVLLAFLSSCDNGYFDEGYVDLSSGYVMDEEETYKVYTLNHPCLMHTNADFQFIINKIKASAEPWTGAWKYLKSVKHTQLNDNWINDAPEVLVRNPSGGNFTLARHPGLAAYYLALCWRIATGLGETEANAYAEKAMKILDNWATVCKKIQVEDTNDHYALVTGFDGLRFVQAAEIMRDYQPWKDNGGFSRFQNWLKDVISVPAAYFLSQKTDPYYSWGGWELPNVAILLQIGIVCDDQDMINYAVNYYRHGPSSGCIQHLVVALHEDPAGLGKGFCLGQSDESGRDQDHAGLSQATLGPMCQAAYNIGEDLYGIKANDTFVGTDGKSYYRYPKYAEYGDVYLTLAFFEYYAKFNCDPTETIEMPYTYWETRHGQWPVISYQGRGHFYAGWEMIYNHYKEKGIDAPYSKKFAEKYRPASSAHPYEYDDDFPGIGTLMFYRGE